MEFPHNHHSHTDHHHHHQRRDEDDFNNNPSYPPPPFSDNQFPPPNQQPPFYHHHQQPDYPSPPPPQIFVSHISHQPPPPHQDYLYSQPPPPQQTHVTHTYHEPPKQDYYSSSSPYANYQTATTQVTHVSHKTHRSDGFFLDKPSFKVYSKADPGFSLAIRDGKVILARSDPSDLYQNWFKDEKFSTRVKDKEGCPCFALVNKGTGQAMKHSIGETHPVQLIPYNPDVLDESILWTESKDLGDGYRAVRMVNNIHLNVDAFHGDEKSGGVHDGTTIVLWKWNKGNNQRWKIVRECKLTAGN